MVNIQITALHLELTPTLREDVNKKFSKLERHFKNITNIHVYLSVEKVDRKMQHKAKAHVALPGGTATAEAISENMYASIDLLIDKLDEEILKHKQKLKDE